MFIYTLKNNCYIIIFKLSKHITVHLLLHSNMIYFLTRLKASSTSVLQTQVLAGFSLLT